MNMHLRTSLSASLFKAGLVCSLLLIPLVTQEQTFFGSGGSTNTATNANNVALGYDALGNNTSGSDNTAIGIFALVYNNSGSNNTAIGKDALYSNNTGSYNTVIGSNALYTNINGSNNTAIGFQTLESNTAGSHNTGNGGLVLASNTAGSCNTANGYVALFYNKMGNYNTADGYYALVNNNGSFNIALGDAAGQYITTGSNNIAIGNYGMPTESGAIRIGTAGTHTSTYIAGINGVTASGGVGVYINSNGQLGTLVSSRRFKHNIQNMGSLSDKLMQLRPVTFRYNDSVEKGPHALQYGLIAEEVAKVYPNLVQYDKAGKPLTVYYHLLTPMLLNELQKAHQTEQVQKTQVASLQAEAAAQKATLQQQSAALQQQSAELASLKQVQEQQRSALAKLSTLVEASQGKAPLQRTVAMQH